MNEVGADSDFTSIVKPIEAGAGAVIGGDKPGKGIGPDGANRTAEQ